jgi:hypothetical protein
MHIGSFAGKLIQKRAITNVVFKPAQDRLVCRLVGHERSDADYCGLCHKTGDQLLNMTSCLALDVIMAPIAFTEQFFAKRLVEWKTTETTA